MKKIFLLTAAIFLLMSSSIAGAQQTDYNLIRVSDLQVQAFVDKMINGNIFQTLKQKGTIFAFTPPERHAELDDQQNFPGLNVYSSLFGLKDSQVPTGEIRFYADPEGYVFLVQFINAGEPQISGLAFLMTMEAIGLTDQEAIPLLKTRAAHAETLCAASARKILRVITDQQGNNVLLLGASE